MSSLAHQGSNGVLPTNQHTTDEAITIVAPTPHLTSSGLLFLLWIAGALTLALLLLQRLRYARGLIYAANEAPDIWHTQLKACQQQLNKHSEIRLKTSSTIPSPAVCGLRKPTVLIPTALASTLCAHEIRATLLHELAHIKRGDLYINHIQALLQVIYFFHPLVWMANIRIRILCEQAVDETVLVALEGDVEQYTDTLINIGEMAFWKADCGLRLLGVAESKRALAGRIKHMLSRPIPHHAKIGVTGLLSLFLAGALLLPMALGQTSSKNKEDNYHVLVLADTDPVFKGKDTYDDRLYMLNSQGEIEAGLSGFNICQSIGGSHRLAVDTKRRTLWVTENVGAFLWHFDLNTGKLIHKIPNLKANSVAIDPDTGNAWVLIGNGNIGNGHIKVISPTGRIMAKHDVSGLDIAYSQHDQCFWVIDKTVTRLDTGGNILGQITEKIPHVASSVSIDENTGHAWIVIRDHPDVANSRPELWVVNPNMTILQKIDLGDTYPRCVSVDPEQKTVWVGCVMGALRFNTQGEKLKSARWVEGRALIAGLPNDTIYSGGLFKLMKAVKGRPARFIWDTRYPIRNVQGLAICPLANAKLDSSPQLAERIPLKQTDLSANHMRDSKILRNLGMCLLLYANDFDDKLPDNLDTLKEFSDMFMTDSDMFIEEDDFAWIKENVEYLGKDITMHDKPTRILAYDKTQYDQGKDTFALYLDSHVALERSKDIKAAITTQTQTISVSPESFFYKLEPVVANLNEPGATRYVRTELVLIIHPNYNQASAQPILDAHKAHFKHFLSLYLADLQLNEVRGEANLKRILKDVTQGLSDVLPQMTPPLIKKVLCEAIAIQ
ncbi:MAG: flagellar basal body-associated FliL family protein [Phycisphaeraceae bacterium]|nr:flagellar basal body-associated FliL family protein [Phycisphaeraceae bacterium]